MARICVPVCVARVSELPGAIRRAAEFADVVELRLDYLLEAELNNSLIEISEIVRSSPRPVILTLRPVEQGGRRSLTVDDRLNLRAVAPRAENDDFWDTELDLVTRLSQNEKDANDVVGGGFSNWDRTICSHHDFVGVPPNIESIYARMAETRARILKLAYQADDAIDCLPILRLLKRAKQEGREFIGIAMGPAGAMTRILGPSLGSYLTFASFDDQNATAPGQLTARELRDVYRVDAINSQTEIFGIIGNPISQSLSPYIHNAAFAATGLNAVYLALQTSDVNQFMRRMVNPRTREFDWNLRGLSVTIPHKSTIIPLLDSIDETATEIGAVNTIIVKDGRLLGHNTDAAGFISPLRDRFGSLAGARCAVIGSGGAARAAVWALKNERAEVALFARNREKAAAVANGFDVVSKHMSGADFSGFDVVVNATPLGTIGANQTATPATAAQLARVRLAYDLVYNPTETQFLSEARQAGCETLGGIQMLLAQAAEQFKLWIGKEPDMSAIRSSLPATN